MKALKTILAVIVLLMATTDVVNAQSSNDLEGKWQTIYSEGSDKVHVTYEFKKITGKLQAYSVLLEDGKGEKTKDNTLAMSNVQLKKGEGTCKYSIKYEGETYDVTAKLNLKDNNTLEVSYSYYGYSDTEVWKRVN